MRREPPFDESLLEEWRAMLNALPNVKIEAEPKRPNVGLAVFAADTTQEQLLAALDWALEQIRK